MLTSHTAHAETNMTTARRAHRLRSYLGERLAPLAATVAVLAAIAGGTSGEAKAAVYFTDGTYAHATTKCISVLNWNATKKTRWIEMTVTAGSGVWMQSQIYVNGRYASSSPWTLQGNGTYSVAGPKATVAYSAPEGTVSVIVQFAKFINGRWEYSPNGSFQYADHETTGYGYTTHSGQSCLLF